MPHVDGGLCRRRLVSGGGRLERRRRRLGGATILVVLLLLAAPAAAALRATTDVNTTITIGGSPVTVTLPTAGEIGYVTFAGSSGQNLGLGLSANTIGTVTVTVKRPDGSTLASKLLVGSADELDFTLNVSGTYTIVVDPYQTATGSITLTLSEDLVSSISIGGSSTTVTTTRAGENARVTFSGTSGQNLGLGITGNTTTGVQVLVRRPDGSTLSSGIFVASGERDFTLDVTGSFTMFVDPIEARTGSITFTLSEDLVATIAIGGSTTSVTTTRPGENARITFSGTAGQHLGVGLTANTTTGLELSVKSPAWTTVSSAILVSIGELDASLTASGTHTVFVDPVDDRTGSVSLLLSHDVMATTTVGGAATSVTITREGQNARVTFSGATYQPLHLSLTGVSIGTSTCCTAYARIRRPDESNQESVLFGTNGKEQDLAALSQTGTHTVFVDPDQLHTGSATVRLYQSGAFQKIEQTRGPCIGKRHTKSGTYGCPADPVNSLTGAFTTSVTDLELPGTGIPFSFVRSYSSDDPTQGRLGIGWTDNFAASLTVQGSGDVLFHGDAGELLLFARQADGTFAPPPGSLSTLVAVSGEYELKTTDLVRYRFTSQGRLSSIKDRNDNGLTLAYDGSNKLTTITDSAGRDTTLTYNGSPLSQLSGPGGTVAYVYTNNRLTSVTDVAGKQWTYRYDGSGRLDQETDPLGHAVVTNVYNANGRVTSQTDALGRVTTLAWNESTQTLTITDARNNVWKDDYTNNVLTQQVDALGRTTNYAYDAQVNQTSVTAPTGEATAMVYDARGNLTQATAPASLGGAQKTITYDTNNNVTSVTDARGKVTAYGYDANGNNTTVVQDGITVATNVYNGSGQLTGSTDGRGKTTTYTYDTNGNLASVTDPLGNKTTYGYDAAGRMTSIVEPRGNVQGADPNQYKTTYTYDAAGRLLTETDPLGNTTTHVYDNAGNRTSTTDARGKTTTFTYDAANRLLTETAADTGVTTYTYDVVGNKLTEVDPRGKTTTYTYDANNRLASVTTPLGNKTTYFHDLNGNLTKEVEPRGNIQGANPDDYDTLYTYDAAGRMLTETDPLGNAITYTYDAVGNRMSVRDARNNTTTYAYDGLNRLTTVTAPGGAATTYTYDTAGNLLTRTDANNHVTSYQYDDAGRQITMTRPLNRQWTYAYDAAGNLTQVVDANGNATQTAGDGTTTYTYDRAGRQTGIDYSDSTPDVTFSYDAVANRTQMTDGAGTQTYAYDNVNRMTSVTRGADTFSYLYDLGGNITRRTYPDATVIDYAYDDDSRLQSATNGGSTTSYAYDAAGNLTATTLPAANGNVEERTYDRAGRLTRVKSVKAGNTLVDFTYTLDAAGNPTQVVRAGSAAGTTTYTYDVRDRLTEVCFQASCPGGSDPFIRWTYDGVGNRLTEARPAGTTNYTYNAADELTQAAGTAYSYDANGNQTSKGSRTFAYDLANRLTATASGGSTTTYSYDGDGNRTIAATAAATTRYLWDTVHRLPQLALERNGSGALIRRYAYGLRRISMDSGGSSSYYHYDNVDSVANLTSPNGTSQRTYAYEPFGATRVETQDDPSAPQNVMMFTGELYEENESYYLRARTYDTASGRFLQHDPAVQAETDPHLSAYLYAGNQPTALIDPSGMCATKPALAGQAVVRMVTSSAGVEADVPSAEPCARYRNTKEGFTAIIVKLIADRTTPSQRGYYIEFHVQPRYRSFTTGSRAKTQMVVWGRAAGERRRRKLQAPVGHASFAAHTRVTVAPNSRVYVRGFATLDPRPQRIDCIPFGGPCFRIEIYGASQEYRCDARL
jgi:RHS repeat-associated protein